MLKRIILYFLLLFCFLREDGLLVVMNSFQKAANVSVFFDFSCEDTFEEDSFEDFWYHGQNQSDIPEGHKIKTKKMAISDLNARLLKVHLEQVGPPPECV